MRRNTEARLPEISREGSISSNGSVSRRGSTTTPQSVESACRSAPSCSALLSFSAIKIKPLCLAPFHSSSRKSAIIPNGAADEIKSRASFILAEEGRRTPFAFGRPISLIIPSCCPLQKLVSASASRLSKAPTGLSFHRRTCEARKKYRPDMGGRNACPDGDDESGSRPARSGRQSLKLGRRVPRDDAARCFLPFLQQVESEQSRRLLGQFSGGRVTALQKIIVE
jgi:hypothetical protein